MLAWMSGSRKNENDDVCNRTSSLCGYLWKLKKSHQKKILVNQWSKRWFSIEGRWLKWYAVASSGESSGMVDLRFITNVSEFEAQGVYSFILSYPDRVLLLRASSLSDMTKWIRALQFQADIVRGGCGMTIVTQCNAAGSSPQGKGRAIKEKYRPATLEANLQAAMVRLEILEDSVRKQSSDFKKKQPEKSSRNIGSDKCDTLDRRSEESKSDLKTDDVRLLDSTRLNCGCQKSPQKFVRRDKTQTKEKGNHTHTRNHENGDDNGTDDGDEYKHVTRNKNRVKDDKVGNEDYHDNEEGGLGGRYLKGTRSSSNNNIKRQPEDGPGSHSDRVASGKSSKDVQSSGNEEKACCQNTSTYADVKDAVEVDKNKVRRKSIGEESIEDIAPISRTITRQRSQITRQRDLDRERDRSNNREGRGSGTISRAESPSTNDSERCCHDIENGDDNNGRRNPNWGYEGEVYNCLRKDSFEGSISRRQSQALNIAAGRAASYRKDKEKEKEGYNLSCGNSNCNSNRTADLNDCGLNSDYEDLPEMDLTAPLRKSSQRRERKAERENEKEKEKERERERERERENGKAPSTISRTESQGSLGWV